VVFFGTRCHGVSWQRTVGQANQGQIAMEYPFQGYCLSW